MLTKKSRTRILGKVKLSRQEVMMLRDLAKDNKQSPEELIENIIHMFLHTISEADDDPRYIS